jgi:YegS/Rv2252/BmrU family lipid kinase
MLQPVLLELERLGVEHSLADTTSADHAREIAAEAAAAGETVAACGGDGMVGLVAGAVNGTDGALGIIPGGRGNDFARVLGIPSDPGEAARVAAEGTETMLDIAFCDGRAFVGIASCGFDSDANRIANETKIVKGNLVYLYAALKALYQWKPATFTVVIDGEEHVVTGYSVVVGNSKAYGGGMYVLPEAELDDGELDIMLSADSSKRRFLANLPKVFKGKHGDDPATTFLRGERVEVSADRPFVMYADGDPIADLPATVSVQKRSLRVLVPSQP